MQIILFLGVADGSRDVVLAVGLDVFFAEADGSGFVVLVVAVDDLCERIHDVFASSAADARIDHQTGFAECGGAAAGPWRAPIILFLAEAGSGRDVILPVGLDVFFSEADGSTDAVCAVALDVVSSACGDGFLEGIHDEIA